jgi:hypothetical protein
METMLKKHLFPLLLIFLNLVASPSFAQIQQAFLVQNSGWMEPFYVDPNSQFKQLISEVARRVTNDNDTVFTVAFSQSSGGNKSPQILSEDKGAGKVSNILNNLEIAKKDTSGVLADTDFKEAIVKTISEAFKTKPGIIWIFTNNKNSPNNDPGTAARNKEFYDLIHVQPSIKKTVVFPLRMAVTGNLYSAKGIMIYALAYGETASIELERILSSDSLKQLLDKPPAMLKPLNINALSIVPAPLPLKNTPNVTASLARNSRTVILDVAADKFVPKVIMKGSLKNEFYPYVIEQGTIRAMLKMGTKEVEVNVKPNKINNLQPGASHDIEVEFSLPFSEVPSAWSKEAMLAMGKQVIFPMEVYLDVAQQKLGLSKNFEDQLNYLFPGDPISDIFLPPQNIQSSTTKIPLWVRVQYPLTPVVVSIFLILGTLACLIYLGMLSSSSKRYYFVIDGIRRPILLKPRTTVEISNDQGEIVGHVQRGWGAPKVLTIQDGHTLIVSVQ